MIALLFRVRYISPDNSTNNNQRYVLLRKWKIIFIVQRSFNAVDPTILIKIIVHIPSDEQPRNGEDIHIQCKERRRTPSHRHQFFVGDFFLLLFELHNWCMHNADWKEPVFIGAVIYVAQYLPIILDFVVLFPFLVLQSMYNVRSLIRFQIARLSICAKGFRIDALYIKAKLHGIWIISLWFSFVWSASRSEYFERKNR